MRRRLPSLYLFASLGLALLTGVVIGQQQIGNPNCEVAPDGSCAFLDCLGGPFPAGCTPNPVLQKRAYARALMYHRGVLW